MKPVSRIQINHHEYEGPRLHNDLNKLVTETNDTFTVHQMTIDAHTATIASLLARIAKLENGKP